MSRKSKNKYLYTESRGGCERGYRFYSEWACEGGGSNAIGLFYDFPENKSVRLIGCEAAGHGIDTGRTAATMSVGSPGIFHGMKSYFFKNEYGQIAPVYSISAGLDYPGAGPEHGINCIPHVVNFAKAMKEALTDSISDQRIVPPPITVSPS